MDLHNSQIIICIWLWLWHRIITLDAIGSRSLRDDVIKWKHFPRNWPFVSAIQRSPITKASGDDFSLICAWIHSWVNNREASDLRRHRAHYDVIVMADPLKRCDKYLRWHSKCDCFFIIKTNDQHDSNPIVTGNVKTRTNVIFCC